MTKYLVQCNFSFDTQERAEVNMIHLKKQSKLYFLIPKAKENKQKTTHTHKPTYIVFCHSDKIMKDALVVSLYSSNFGVACYFQDVFKFCLQFLA